MVASKGASSSALSFGFVVRRFMVDSRLDGSIGGNLTNHCKLIIRLLQIVVEHTRIFFQNLMY